MSFTGNENHSISLEEASKLTANYRKSAGEDAVIAGFVGKTAIENIINQADCVGIRFYFGQHDDGKPDLVLVGAKANMGDLIDGIITERLIPCPPNCAPANVLNSD
ncbi:MAG: hypothetical protein ABIA75_14075 [Candidatus Neomarinimicrobiota bacterium]